MRKHYISHHALFYKVASRIFALVLEANPKLTWRDLQHLIVNTSKKTDPRDPEWRVNGAGHHFNNKYGFGVLDTAALVDAAMDRRWETADDQHICKELGGNTEHVIPKKGTFTATLFTDGCSKKENCITRLEHVRVYITIEHPRRGDLSINLTSPSGITHELLKPRDRDFSGDGFVNWPFMTVFSWGENPRGIWTLKVTDNANFDKRGKFKRWTLRMYGTCERPKPQITPFERKVCEKNCKKGCASRFSASCWNCTQYCHCGSGQCVQLCNEEDEVSEKDRHCVPPHIPIKNDTHAEEDSGELSTFVKWLIIFSLLAILVATVLIMYLFKTSGKFCWARPVVVEKNSAPPRHLIRNTTPTASIRSINTDRRRSEPRSFSYPKNLDSNDGPNTSNMIYI
ncbi:Proprotein convertase subtilisin/kexin type 6 [Exaiptasia diaphana]|nr:Proprotein convertase subtilisin/kexin type 6 [Exaiptasia diaphana]